MDNKVSINPAVLFVDDEKNVLSSLKRLFNEDAFEVKTASSAADALEIIKQNTNIAVIVSDQCMPGIKGLDLLERVKNIRPGIIRILLTGYSEMDLVIDAINLGSIYRYIQKPWDDTGFVYEIRQAVERYCIEAENIRLGHGLKDKNSQLIEKNKEISKTNQDLHDEIKKRIRLEEKMEKALVAAEAATRAKSDFLSNISHEVRTPMNGVIGMNSLLLEMDLAPDARKYANIIQDSAGSLLRIINDILDFSRIEAGKMEIEIIDFDLRSTVEKTVEMMKVQADAKGIELSCRIDPDVPAFVRGDPGRIRQVLTNLIGNAVKFTAEGWVCVDVGLETQWDESILVGFMVRDTGAGIPEDRFDDIFDMFTQVDASWTRKYGGTGLGLAISKQLVGLMGGKISVKSMLGQGSTFFFTVMLDRQASVPVPFFGTAEDVYDSRILVVNDNRVTSNIIIQRLEAWGFRAGSATDDDMAMEMLGRAIDEGKPFCMAILDMQMPGMGGEALGKAIKADKKLSATSLIIQTLFGEKGDASHFKDAGFDAYLTKPVSASYLYDCIVMVLSRDQSRPNPIVTRHSINENRKHSIRVLLAEDMHVNQVVAVKTLEHLGFLADVVDNGAQAIDALESGRYDLVLMDIEMPVLDGVATTKKIRGSGTQYRDIPIIAMTAYAMNGDRERFLDAGMDDCLSKPLCIQDLEQLLKKHGFSGSRTRTMDLVDNTRDKEILDRDAFLDHLGGDKALLRDVLNGFIEEIPLKIKGLEHALNKKDKQGSIGFADTIKGACANIEAGRLRDVADRMDSKAREGDLFSVRAYMQELNDEFEDVRRIIHKELKEKVRD
ncbi:MAG: response regulator [Thermodesulfobacteriota bacterium]|nr:response regulator [Thermodesulfobacteriota bacterium]